MTPKPLKFSAWIVLNSMAAFLTSAVINIFLYFFLQALLAKMLGVESKLFFGELQIFTPTESWNRLKVLLVYGFPIGLSFVFVLLSYRFYVAIKRTNDLLKIYVLWWHIFSVSMLCGSLIHGVAVYKSLAVVVAWLGMPKVINTIFGLIGLIVLGVWGSFWGNFFVKMCPSQRYEVHLYPKLFMLQVAILPAVLGSIVLGLLLLRAVSIPILIFLSGVWLMLTVATLLKEGSFEKILLVKDFPLDRFQLIPLVLCVLFLWLAKMLAIYGISF